MINNPPPNNKNIELIANSPFESLYIVYCKSLRKASKFLAKCISGYGLETVTATTTGSSATAATGPAATATTTTTTFYRVINSRGM